ncbi:conjugal transfer protein TraG N-terminal domain-containing protein [Glaesserella parasuis]|nr:conjugal transfer protein TraG N-terminal domain-containing protein [Glaesserella parasuis]
MAIEITILNGVDVLAQAFNAVAAFVNNETWFSLLAIAEFLGIFAAAIAYVKSQDIKGMFLWLLTFVLINALLLTPKERVVITDLANPTVVKQVNNVPIGVAYPLYMVTNIGNSIARTYDTFFSQPEDIQYSKTGLLFGQRLLEESFYLTPSDSELDANLNNYIKSCVIERQLINPTTWKNLKDSKELFQTLYQGKDSDYVSYKSGSATSFQKCSVAGRSIAQAINQSSSGNSYIQKIMRSLGLSTSPTNLPQFKDKLSTVQSYFMGSSKSASEIYTQNMLVNAYRRAFDNYPVSLDNSADLIAQASEQSLTKMKLAHLSSYNVAGRMLPALHTVLLVLMVSIFPIMVLAMFVREFTAGVVKNYFAVLCSLMMWPVLFAVFNSIINTLTYQTLNGEAFTLSTMDTMKENAASIAGVASWLMLSIPFISFKLTTNLGQNIASAGSYLGNSLAGATSADAGQVAAGNYAWGNMQMHNINGNKVDLNSVYRVGQSTVQTANGGLAITNADGSYSYDAAGSLSRLPFNVNWSNAISSSWNERTTMAISQEARNSSGVRESLTNALSHLTGFNSGSTYSTMDGKDWSDNNGINKVTNVGSRVSSGINTSTSHDTSTGTQSSEGLQAGISGSAGFSLFGNGVTASAGVNASENDVANDSKANADRKHIETLINSGTSFDKIDGYIESIKGGYSNTNFHTVLNNVQRDIREANERYNDYVEIESKSLNSAKESILSNTESIQVSRQLDSAVYRYMKENYNDKELAAALDSAPSQLGISLQDKAIKAVTDKYIDNIVDSHHSNAEKLGYSYNGKNLNSLKGNDFDSAINEGGNWNANSLSHIVNDKNITDSIKKARLVQEFDEAQKGIVSSHTGTRTDIDNDKKIIEEKSKNVADKIKFDKADNSSNVERDYIIGPNGRRIYKNKK